MYESFLNNVQKIEKFRKIFPFKHDLKEFAKKWENKCFRNRYVWHYFFSLHNASWRTENKQINKAQQ